MATKVIVHHYVHVVAVGQDELFAHVKIGLDALPPICMSIPVIDFDLGLVFVRKWLYFALARNINIARICHVISLFSLPFFFFLQTLHEALFLFNLFELLFHCAESTCLVKHDDSARVLCQSKVANRIARVLNDGLHTPLSCEQLLEALSQRVLISHVDLLRHVLDGVLRCDYLLAWHQDNLQGLALLSKDLVFYVTTIGYRNDLLHNLLLK